MSFLATAKTKVANGNVKEAFKNEEGAIDLASIMVGIIVIGMIGGVIAATVFAVIPWAQDNAAKQQLDSVSAAQASYIGLSSQKGSTRFGGGFVSATTTVDGPTYAYTKVSTVGGDATVTESLFTAPSTSKVAIGFWGVGTAAHYGVAVKSSSGKTWYISDTKTDATELTITQQAASTPANELEAIAFSVKSL